MTGRVKKKFGLWDNCYQMLSLSVIQCKEMEKERLVKEREKTHGHFWMNFSTATWTPSILSFFSSFLFLLYTSDTHEVKKVCLQWQNSQFVTKTTRGLAPTTALSHFHKAYLFCPQHSSPYNSTVSNGWLCSFPLFILCSSYALCTSKMKRFDVGLMWQWGGVPGSAWIERQLWQAWCCSCKL